MAISTSFKVFLLGLFVFLAFAVLNPNPFGNNPDIVGDESYFLSTALFSIEKMTLPGWEFSPSGAYYGGPQTYLDTAVLIPVLGAVVAASDFSVIAAKLWVAQNTGELLHVLRLVNGMAVLGALLLSFLYFKKRNIPRSLALTLTLFLFLLLSNVLVIELVHTAKMWVLYIVFIAVMSTLFAAQEYFIARRGTPLIATNRYVALWVWSAILTFFQSWVGVFSIVLLMSYALILRHMRLRDVWEHIRKYWYLIVLFAASQIGFAYRLFSILGIFSGINTRTAEGAIEWSARFLKPLSYTMLTQPLSVLYVVALVGIAIIAFRNPARFAERRARLWILIVAAHPVLVYLIFHVGLGFDAGPRYAIFLTMACALSAALLLAEIGTRATLAALIAAGALFAVLGVHAIGLFWRPSSEVDLLRKIEQMHNSADNVFIADHSAKRLTLPVNYESLPLQGETRLAMGRFDFLLDHRESLPKESAFKPLAFIAYTAEEEAAYAERSAGTRTVWMIRRSCANKCGAAELKSGACFEVHLEACVISPQDTNALPEFLSSQQLGNSYIVRRVR